MFPGARLFRASIRRTSGGGGTREAGSTAPEEVGSTPSGGQLDRRAEGSSIGGRRAVRSSMSQGSAEPLCVRIRGANWEVSEGKTDL